MKKTHIFGIVAFLSGIVATIAGIAYYLNKKQKEAEEFEDILYNEDYLADYMPKDNEECCCCGEEENTEDCCCCGEDANIEECCCGEETEEYNK